MGDYPQSIVPVGHVEPVPRRVRGLVRGEVVFDTLRALYVWEWPHYPQYYIPLADVKPGAQLDEQRVHQPAAGSSPLLAGTVRFDWDALDAWFEEDEQVFVHPRDPYSRVDALRSTRAVRVELDGVLLAESSSPVMVFETGLPPRCYLNRTEVDFDRLVPSDTVTACPYKGTTSSWWSVRVGEQTYPDLAWAYDFPTRQLLPIAGLIAFYDEQVDVTLDGVRVPRPVTHFSR